MKECDKSKTHIKSNFLLSVCLLIMLRHLITRTITTLQHFATLHHTSPNYTSLHLSTLHFLSFTIHYPLIRLNPSTFPTVLFHLISINQTQYSSSIYKIISKIMNPFTALKKPSPFHFTFSFTYPINPSLHFTLLFISTSHFLSLHFPSLFTLYRLYFPSLVFTSLTLVLKICVLPWEVLIVP
jgi:hypothetical protein